MRDPPPMSEASSLSDRVKCSVSRAPVCFCTLMPTIELFFCRSRIRSGDQRDFTHVTHHVMAGVELFKIRKNPYELVFIPLSRTHAHRRADLPWIQVTNKNGCTY